jgi:hypothetical protein
VFFRPRRSSRVYNTVLDLSDSVWSDRHSRLEDDGLALSVAVKPHAFGVPLTRFRA